MTQPNIQGVILIDAWQDDKLKDFYQGIADRTADLNIRCCVNASYALDLSCMLDSIELGRDISMHNTFRMHHYNRLYGDQNYDESRRRDNELIMNVIRHSHGKGRTDPRLATPNLLMSHASVMALEIEDFLHHCRSYHNNEIKDWLVAGQAWMMCLHFRPMGLYALANLIQSHGFNIYVTPWSVLDKDHRALSRKSFRGLDPIIWQEVPGFGYRIAGCR